MKVEMSSGRETEHTWHEFVTQDERERIMSSSELVSFRKGETVIKQGTAASQIYFLESGMVKLLSEDDNRMTVFKILADNMFVGLMCSFAQRRFDFTAVTITPSRVRIIDRKVIEETIRSNGDFAMHIVNLMSVMTNKIVSDLIGLSHKQAEGAISTILLELADIFGSNSYQMPFSRIELADTVGYSKESVINCLSSLHSDGIITVSGKSVVINDTDRLKRIARHG
jgi:CRP/FNR family transcriptional regulator, anaerobic regulatory protein